MTDVVLIQDGKAHHVTPGATLSTMHGKFTSELVAAMVEVQSGSVQEGWLWDGTSFTPPPTQEAEPPVEDMARLGQLLTLAVSKQMRGHPAGDLYWHGGSEPFEWLGTQYDIEGWITYAEGRLATG